MSDSPITKKELEHLAELARLKLDPQEEEKLLADLQAIVGHVQELQEVNTEGVTPMSGGSAKLTTSGSLNTNVFRDDTSRESTNQGKGVEQFPEKERGYLKVPPVFE